jgi:hypothetical protein
MFDTEYAQSAEKERLALLRKIESLGLYEANLEVMLNLTERAPARRPIAY